MLVLGIAGVVWLLREPLLGWLDQGGPLTVQVGRAERAGGQAPAAGDVTANGYVVADRMASLSTPLSGRLVHLAADVGDEVKAESIVARIFAEDLEAVRDEAKAGQATAEAAAAQASRSVQTATLAVQQAEAELAALRAQGGRLQAAWASARSDTSRYEEAAGRATREVERQRPLFESGRLDGSAFDTLLTQAREAEAALEAARHAAAAREAEVEAWQQDVLAREAAVSTAGSRVSEAEAAATVAAREADRAARALATAEVQVDKTRIRAPFTGLVIRKDAEVGEVLAPMGAGNSRGSVLTIVDPESFGIQVELSERRILSVRDDARVSIFLDAEPDRGWPGHVSQVWPRADRSKGTIEVRVAFDERPVYARPDMAARVVFHAGAVAPAAEAPFLGVPEDAIVGRGVDRSVWVVVEGRLERRRVEVGRQVGARVEITSGLAEGDVVVRHPTSELSVGQAVTAAGGGAR